MLKIAKTPSVGSKLPHVEVVVPCYKYGHFLEACVLSIINQPNVRTSVRIIDDASPDDSFAVAKQLSERYPNVRAERNKENLGHIATYNKGLSQVDSDYVVLLSADDMLAPGALGRATALMEQHSEVGMVYGHPQAFEVSPIQAAPGLVTWSVWSGQDWIDRQFKRGLSIVYSPEAVVRTSVHHAVGYYQPELPHSGDLEMWLRIAEVSQIGRVNGADQAYRRTHAQSMMNSEFAGVLTDLEERMKAFQWYLEHVSQRHEHKSKREMTMRRRLAEEALDWAMDQRSLGRNENTVSTGVDFAISMYSKCERLASWEGATASSFGGIRQATLRSRRVLVDKLRWRRWRHLGT